VVQIPKLHSDLTFFLSRTQCSSKLPAPGTSSRTRPSPCFSPELYANHRMHHHRRRSGHVSSNTSLTDVRKAVTATDPSYKKHSSRPAAMTRRTTPQSVPKLGKNPRDREKELDEQRWWDEERESFPEYWYVASTFLCFTTSSRPCPFPSGHFRFHPPALSPDMQVISAPQLPHV
jgi:hypothetical protein